MHKIGIYGANGKVGQEVIKLVIKDPNLTISYTHDNAENNNVSDLCQLSDIVIDFSSPQGLNLLLENAVNHNTPLVIGVTGYSEEQFETIRQAASVIPILYSANMSLGISIIAKHLPAIVQNLGQDYKPVITELHHKNKKDKPSGTALMLADIINSNADYQYQSSEILSMRAGQDFCNHDIMFISDHEIVSISHKIINRSVFAKAACQAAKWLIGKPAKLYSYQDIINNL